MIKKKQKWIRTDGSTTEMEKSKVEKEYYEKMYNQECLIIRWQEYRDQQNELISDRSPFWNTMSLLSPFTEE